MPRVRITDHLRQRHHEQHRRLGEQVARCSPSRRRPADRAPIAATPTIRISARIASRAFNSRFTRPPSRRRSPRRRSPRRSSCPRSKLVDDAALLHDEHAVGQAHHLGQFRRDQHHRQALGGQFADEVVDGRLGADVDALGRLVENDHLRPRRQPFGDDDLLLVAARKLAEPLLPVGGLHGEPAAERCASRPAPTPRDRNRPRTCLARLASVTFSRMPSDRIAPCSCRSSGT